MDTNGGVINDEHITTNEHRREQHISITNNNDSRQIGRQNDLQSDDSQVLERVALEQEGERNDILNDIIEERDDIIIEEGQDDLHIPLVTRTNTSPQHNGEKKSDNKPTKRKSSYVLSIIPGRRTSASLQYIKIPRSLRPYIHHSSDSTLREEEEREGEEGEGIEVIERHSWIKEKLIGFKKGIIKGFKDLKMFAK